MCFIHINYNHNRFVNDKGKRDEEHKHKVNHTRYRVSRPRGNIDVGGSKYEGYGLMLRGSEPLLMGRKLKGLKPMESGTKKRSTKASRDSTKEIDNLMRSDYPSRMKGRKRTPIHN
ncbi:hypothetical protein IGI04_011440 [Brassica rapa subsp. trilocularis]|uniref:Uncharacterized protein n=1 Tax=Brassica rapa subsp. trilocularis TaxID=1813537 RepID=A0ABQ7N571_BRACM|nr:hypothetical protein IGI04_011440 [Brassica rapa subsp. trilocularis]